MIAGSRLQAIILYFCFSLVDYWFTVISINFGADEGSPLFSWAISHHIFFPIKISIVLFASALMYFLYEKFSRGSLIAWSAVYLMTAITIYQGYNLSYLAYHYPHYYPII